MEIKQSTFGPRNYLTLKKNIKTNQISDSQMYDSAFKKLTDYVNTNNMKVVGPGSLIYFTWDDKNQTANIGLALPIENYDSIKDPELTVTTIPESKAILAVLKGPYNELRNTHQALWSYFTEKKLVSRYIPVRAVEEYPARHIKTPPSFKYQGTIPIRAIEEYVISPMQTNNIDECVTNVYYLY